MKMRNDEHERIRSTTIIAVRRGNECAIAGDGQVTQGDMVMKHTARKIRTLRGGAVALPARPPTRSRSSTASSSNLTACRAICAAPPSS